MIKREDGTLFLDRCPEYFHLILNRLRNPESVPIEPADELGKLLFRLEEDFYKIKSKQ